MSSSQVNCVAVFPDGRRVVSGSYDNKLKVWDVATGKCVSTLQGHTHNVRRAASAFCSTFVMIVRIGMTGSTFFGLSRG